MVGAALRDYSDAEGRLDLLLALLDAEHALVREAVRTEPTSIVSVADRAIATTELACAIIERSASTGGMPGGGSDPAEISVGLLRCKADLLLSKLEVSLVQGVASRSALACWREEVGMLWENILDHRQSLSPLTLLQSLESELLSTMAWPDLLPRTVERVMIDVDASMNQMHNVSIQSVDSLLRLSAVARSRG
jgi:hypothetical protein